MSLNFAERQKIVKHLTKGLKKIKKKRRSQRGNIHRREQGTVGEGPSEIEKEEYISVGLKEEKDNENRYRCKCLSEHAKTKSVVTKSVNSLN